jgi:tetratricopeptide (TPR) repeat protein
LAIAQAGRYLQESGIGLSTYIKLYKKRWRDLMDSGNDAPEPVQAYPNRNIRTAWTRSFRAIEAKNKYAARLLLLWSFLANHNMCFKLFEKAYGCCKLQGRALKWVRKISKSEVIFIEAMRLLQNHSLAECGKDNTNYITHPVVLQWARHYQTAEQCREFARLAVMIAGHALPHEVDPEYASLFFHFLPHAHACYNWIISYDLITWKKSSSDFDQAKQETFLNAIGHIANLFASSAKFREAEDLLNVALQFREQNFGPNHRSTMVTVTSLGLVYMSEKKFSEAEAMFKRALTRWEELPGPSDGFLVSAFINLGDLYVKQERLSEAEEMYKRALDELSRMVEVGYERILAAYMGLGNIYTKQGKFTEAEQIYLSVLQTRQQEFGSKHLLCIHTVYKLAHLYYCRGEMDGAEKTLREVLQAYEDNLSPELHYRYEPMLAPLALLGEVLLSRGEADEAESVWTKALRGYQAVQDPCTDQCEALERRLISLKQQRGMFSGVSSNRTRTYAM